MESQDMIKKIFDLEEVVSKEKLKSLFDQSVETLDSILRDQGLSVHDRAKVAFKILEMAGLPAHGTYLGSSPSVDFSAHATHGPSTQINQASENTLPINFLQIDNFLLPEEYQQALNIALNNEEKFIGSTTTTQETDYRQSKILYATLFPEFYNFLRNKILNTLPSILSQLSHPAFALSEFEMQMTAHNDGCYYKTHNDSGSPETLTRELTYVYYFYQEPKMFSGGELKIYETDLKESHKNQCKDFKLVEPRNNSIVFFNSIYMHEVLPVSCPSRKFDHSRFTINGWLRRTEGFDDQRQGPY
jgi:Rps23 Pro-64 3,4-dihydroxylase Tpa1-like proline 4-hydroxylase